MVAVGGDPVGCLDPVDDVVKSAFPHLEWGRGRAVGFEAEEGELHDDPVEACGCVTLELPKGGLRKMAEVVVEYLAHGGILTLASWLSKLAWVDQVVP